MTRNEKSLQALFSNTEIIKSSTGTIHCVYLSDITPTEWTKDMALAAIKNSVTNYGYYEYNGKKGLCIVGDFEDIYNFIESAGYVVDEDNLYHWKEFPWDNAKKLDAVKSSRRPIKSATAKDCEYYVKVFDDYGMIKIEYFYDKEDALKYAEEKNRVVGLTAEVRNKLGYEINSSYKPLNSSRRPIKSGYDILNVGNKTPAGNLVFYLVNDGKRMPIMTEDYAIREGGYDKDYLYKGSKNGEFVRFDGFDRIINRLAEGCGITEYIDQIEYSIKGNKVEFTVYPTERGIHLLNNGWWDNYSVKWELSAEEQIPLYDGDEIVAMTVTLTILGL